MADKLESSDPFPQLPLTMVSGDTLLLPAQPECNYLVVLFYRGAF